MRVTVGEPFWILLLPILVAILLVTVVKGRLANNRKLKSHLIVRSLVLGLLILALMGISLDLRDSSVATIFLVDLSDSVGHQSSQATTLIKEAMEELPENEKIGIVTFGKDTKLEQFVSDKKLFEEFTSEPVKSATNLEKAVQSAMSMYPEDVGKRLCIVTDGRENEGQIINMCTTLTSNQVEVAYLKLGEEVKQEVYVDSMLIPENVNIGDTFSVKVTIQSNVNTSASLSLYQNDKLKRKENVQLKSGSNTFLFQDTQTESGLKGYRVIIEPYEDTNEINNQYVGFTNAKAASSILILEGTPGNANELAKLCKSINVPYMVMPAGSAPLRMNDLLAYKAIIMVNVYGTDLPKGFMNILESYVKDYAGGVIATGGENSFGMGEYKDTVLEKILPVDMEPKPRQEIPKSSYVLVIDHSGSMGSGDGNSKNDRLQVAKQAAIKALDTIKDGDFLGVLQFDDTYSWVSKLDKVSDRSAIEDKINGIKIEGGTSIYPALEEAYQALKEDDAKIKHIILITDGQDSFNQYDDLMPKIEAAGVTVSSVAIGQDADKKLMMFLAEEGNGRYYEATAESNLPRIFAREILMASDTYIKNREFTPAITKEHEMINEVANEGLPILYGYISTKQKPLANVLLSSDLSEPILAEWRYGLGKTIAFTTDVENKWTARFASFENYPMLWKNMITHVITENDNLKDSLQMIQTADGVTLRYETEEYTNETKIEGVYTNEKGESHAITLHATAPGEFETEVELKEIGIYSLSVRKEEKGQAVNSKNTAVARQFSKEYRFDEDNSSFDRFVQEMGAVKITQGNDIFNIPVTKASTDIMLTNGFLIASILLFFLDILQRRVGVRILYYVNKVWDQVRIKLAARTKKRIQKTSSKQIELTRYTEELVRKKSEKKETIKIEKRKLEPEHKEQTKNVQIKPDKVENKSSKTHQQKPENTKTLLDTKTLLQNKNRRK